MKDLLNLKFVLTPETGEITVNCDLPTDGEDISILMDAFSKIDEPALMSIVQNAFLNAFGDAETDKEKIIYEGLLSSITSYQERQSIDESLPFIRADEVVM